MPSKLTISTILQGDATQLTALFSIAAPSDIVNFRIQFGEKLFHSLFNNHQLDSSLDPLLIEMYQAFIFVIKEDDLFYCNNTHPLRQVFDCLLKRACTWYARDSKSNHIFYEKIVVLMQTAMNWALAIGETNATKAQLLKALADFHNWVNSEEKRATMLEERLCEAEINHLKMITAECHVLDLINTALAHKILPLGLVTGIPATLKNELQHGYFTSGINAPFWKTWQRILKLSSNVFTSANQAGDKVDDQILYRDIPILMQELNHSLQLGSGNLENYREFVELYSHSLMQIVQKQTQPMHPMSPLPYPEGHTDLNTRATETVIKQVSALSEGDWIVLTGENNQSIRCKLALKNNDINQMLFVDNTGRKVMSKSYKDFALCLSTGIAKPLKQIYLDDEIATLLQQLIETIDELPTNNIQKTLSNQITEKTDALLPTSKDAMATNDQSDSITSERENIVIEAAARRAAAHKAMTEARAIAEKKARRAEEIKAQDLQKITAEKIAQENLQQEVLQQTLKEEALKQENLQRETLHQESQKKELQAVVDAEHLAIAIQQIAALNVGAMVELTLNEQQKIRCKLAVVIASAGKYIFTDEIGRKVADLHRDELLQSYISNKLSLINNGDRFEDQLAKVIRGLRKDIS